MQVGQTILTICTDCKFTNERIQQIEPNQTLSLAIDFSAMTAPHNTKARW